MSNNEQSTGGFMILKRLINALSTVPLLILLAFALIHCADFIITWVDHFEQSGSSQGFGILISLAAVIAFLVTFMSAIIALFLALWVLIFGEGLIWRRIDRSDFLVDKSGTTVHIFKRNMFLCWCDPIFKGRKLCDHGLF